MLLRNIRRGGQGVYRPRQAGRVRLRRIRIATTGGTSNKVIQNYMEGASNVLEVSRCRASNSLLPQWADRLRLDARFGTREFHPTGLPEDRSAEGAEDGRRSRPRADLEGISRRAGEGGAKYFMHKVALMTRKTGSRRFLNATPNCFRCSGGCRGLAGSRIRSSSIFGLRLSSRHGDRPRAATLQGDPLVKKLEHAENKERMVVLRSAIME